MQVGEGHPNGRCRPRVWRPPPRMTRSIGSERWLCRVRRRCTIASEAEEEEEGVEEGVEEEEGVALHLPPYPNH